MTRKSKSMPSPGSARCMIFGGLSEQEYAADTTKEDVGRIFDVPTHLLGLRIEPRRWDVMQFQNSGIRPIAVPPGVVTVPLPYNP